MQWRKKKCCTLWLQLHYGTAHMLIERVQKKTKKTDSIDKWNDSGSKIFLFFLFWLLAERKKRWKNMWFALFKCKLWTFSNENKTLRFITQKCCAISFLLQWATDCAVISFMFSVRVSCILGDIVPYTEISLKFSPMRDDDSSNQHVGWMAHSLCLRNNDRSCYAPYTFCGAPPHTELQHYGHR